MMPTLKKINYRYFCLLQKLTFILKNNNLIIHSYIYKYYHFLHKKEYNLIKKRNLYKYIFKHYMGGI